LKLYEYLAVGRPIVSTPVAGFVDAGPQVVVARDADFVAALSEGQTALEDSVRPVAVDWADRVAAVRHALDRTADALRTAEHD
jgi:hypothetical protein